MDEHRERIWQRSSARQIMREARRRFTSLSPHSEGDAVSAHIALASAHYSLVKRYLDSWRTKPLAFWHLLHAQEHAHAAYNAAGTGTFAAMTLDQIDVVTRIWSKSVSRYPLQLAVEGIEFALHRHSDRNAMKPHTRALMLITRGNIEQSVNVHGQALKSYEEARKLIPKIEVEDSPDRDQQLVRVLAAVGFFYQDHGGELYATGIELTKQALELARRVSEDQEEKILAEFRKRGAVIQ